MKEIIKWLRAVEHLANGAYLDAASFYSDDENFKMFLKQTAEDEAWHYHVMGSAAQYLASEPEFTPVISVDEETSFKITNYFIEIKDGLANQSISRTELIEKIVEVELSEWNDIFIYVINFLKDKTSEFKYPAARIQAHIKGVEYFLEKVEGRPQLLEKIKQLPAIWTENILIVDDEKMITDLLKALLNRSGNIDIAHNGDQALKMLDNKFYKLIITDIDMPLMDGFSFYKKAVSTYPSSIKKFLFMTGYLSPERQQFFDENQIKYLTKPMDIRMLREEAKKILILE